MATTSVAMATYAGERDLPRQLESILSQTRPVDEIVVTDDSPDDRTVRIAESLLSDGGVEHRVLRNPTRLGPARNFERAIAACRGDIIFLADQDDEWMPRKVEAIVRQFDKQPDIGGFFTNARLESSDEADRDRTLWDAVGFSRHRSAYAEDPLGMHLRRTFVTGATMAFRSSLRELLLPVSDDALHDEWFALLLGALGLLLPVDDELITYRLHGENVAGVPPRSLRTQLKQRRDLGDNEARLIRVYRQALDRLDGSIDRDSADRIHGKISFLEHRRSLSRSPVRRSSQVLAHLPDYVKYSHGLKGPAFDAVFGRPSEMPPTA